LQHERVNLQEGKKTGAVIRQRDSLPVRCCDHFIKFLLLGSKHEKP
jgi:hypothetical protein